MRDDILWYIPGLCGASETTMWHSRQASATVFPHVSLFTKHDDSAKTVPVRCCSWRACVWFFRYIATTSFDRIYPGSKHFVWSGFFQIVFLSALFVGFHSPYQSTLIPVPPSISLMALQGLYPASLIIGPKCSMPPRPISIGKSCDPWKGWCKLDVFSWKLWCITNKKGAESSKFLNLFFHAPLIMRDDVRWYFPGLCGVSETTIWHFRQGSTTTFPHVSLFTKDDDSAKMIPVRCSFWWTCLRHFVPLTPPVLKGFTQGANISL